MTNVFVSIGNSDDKLPQRVWAEFYAEVDAVVRRDATQVFGAWMSNPIDPWQNACWCIEIPTDFQQEVRWDLGLLAAKYHQESIAWSPALPVMLGPIHPAPPVESLAEWFGEKTEETNGDA
jgi:hypothetical protein